MSWKTKAAVARSLAALAVTGAAMLILIATAVAADHWAVRLLCVVAACGAALSTVVKVIKLLHPTAS